MHIIICLDDKYGYSFANRRQSRDKNQIAKMLEAVGHSLLLLSNYSAKLFETLPNNVKVSENFLNIASQGDFCFVETLDITPYINNAEKVIIYRWNRVYPSDKKLPEELLSGKKLISVTDFVGNSHDKITEEVYE